MKRSLWRHRDFMLLWSGQTISEIGSGVTQLAIPLTAVAILKAGTFEVGALSAATSVAFAVIALPAGALVDRLAKRRVMIACDAARLVIVGSVPIAWWAGFLSMAQLYVVAILAGVCAVFFDVAYQSYLPIVLSPKELMDGNGKLSTTQSSAELIGPGLGGALAGAFGAAGAMTADAFSYAVSVASLFSMGHTKYADRPELVVTANPSRLREEAAEGFRFVVNHPILAKIAACSAMANLFGSMGTVLEIIFIVRVLHVRTGYIGLIFVVAAIGSIVGGVVSSRVIEWVGSARVIWVAALVFGFPQLLVALAEPGWGVILFPIGDAATFFSATVYGVAQISYRQAVCPPTLTGRVNAVNQWVMWGTLPVGAVIGGALGTVIGIRGTLWIALTGTWAAGFLVYFSPLRGMRDFPSA